MTQSFIPVLILLLFAIVLGAVMLVLAYIGGSRARSPQKLGPYESGVPQLDVSRKRFNVRFYKVAMSFIIFDIEAVFIFAWAVIYRETTTGGGDLNWLPFIAMMIFTLPIAIGFLYEWKKGTFDWT